MRGTASEYAVIRQRLHGPAGAFVITSGLGDPDRLWLGQRFSKMDGIRSVGFRDVQMQARSRAMMKDLPLSKVYQLLEPGPVVLLTTSRKGLANVMTMSWHMMVEFEPPLVACVVSNANHSFAALRATGECVIAIPALKLAPKVVGVGNCSGRDLDKFAAFGLTPMPAKRVAPPLVAECFANLECKVADTRLVNRYNLFILEVLKAWRDPAQKNPKTVHHHGYGTFVADGETIKLKSKMR